MGLHRLISVRLVHVLSRLVLCSPTSRGGSLSMLRALEFIGPHPCISWVLEQPRGWGAFPVSPGSVWAGAVAALGLFLRCIAGVPESCDGSAAALGW